MENSITLRSETAEIRMKFSQGAENDETKWTLLLNYQSNHLNCDIVSPELLLSYQCIATVLLESYKPSLFTKDSHEQLFDDTFLKGIHHESFLLLIQSLKDCSMPSKETKILNLLQRFLRSSNLEYLMVHQCMLFDKSDSYFQGKVFDNLISSLVSLPERVSNKTRGNFPQIFGSKCYIPLLISSVWKALLYLRQNVIGAKDCSLLFLGKLLGKLSTLGYSDLVTKKLIAEFIRLPENDYLWQRISQKLISNIPNSSLDPFFTQLMINIPWFGYIAKIVGPDAIGTEKIRHLMTVKLIFQRNFQNTIILQNIIGYFANMKDSTDEFWVILSALLNKWGDESSLKYLGFEQQLYMTSALMISAGWLKSFDDVSPAKVHQSKILNGVQIRIASNDSRIRSLGLVVGSHLLPILFPEGGSLNLDEIMEQKQYVHDLKNLMNIPTKPDNDVDLLTETLKDFDFLNDVLVKDSTNVTKPLTISKVDSDEEIDSDDDLEPYSMPSVTSVEKRPLYLRECLEGLIHDEKVEWFEECLKEASNLIEANRETVHEIAVDMVKVLLHLDNKYSFENFDSLREMAMVKLLMICPILVMNYLTAEFYDGDYVMRQRLDILHVISFASHQLSQPLKMSKDFATKSNAPLWPQKEWERIVNDRIAQNTIYKSRTKQKIYIENENLFAPVASYFMFSLLDKLEIHKNPRFDLSKESYVLGTLVNTLAAIMLFAVNVPDSFQMAKRFFEFLQHVRDHKDAFVRRAVIFSYAIIYTSLPSWILKELACFDGHVWLNSIMDNLDFNDQEKAMFAVSMAHDKLSGSLLSE